MEQPAAWDGGYVMYMELVTWDLLFWVVGKMRKMVLFRGDESHEIESVKSPKKQSKTKGSFSSLEKFMACKSSRPLKT